MLFNSLPFIFLFLPASLFVYFLANKKGTAPLGIIWLTLCSLFFYAYWNLNYLPLLLISILMNYLIGQWIDKTTQTPKKKKYLIIGITFNLALLAFFKYTGFLLENIQWLLVNATSWERISLPLGLSWLLLGGFALKLKSKNRNKQALLLTTFLALFSLLYLFNSHNLIASIHWLLNNKLHANQILLPTGISFFTFTQIAFLVDIYLEKVNEYRIINYTLFASYFPHLLAGPIIHHAEMMPQFKQLKRKLLQPRNMYLGLTLFTIGLFKKIVIADTFAFWANAGYNNVTHLGLLQSWGATLSYGFQIYFDFSGYTDMALGISQLFNIQLPINFNSPYKSLSIQDFWRRWHITLSRFLKNYLYIFLGGNRVSNKKVIRNLILIFLIGGIWHGAGWTFIIWGLLHGLGMTIHNTWKRTNITLPKGFAWLLTFTFITLTWVFFRSENVKSAFEMTGNCFNYHKLGSIDPILAIALTAGFILCLFVKNSNELITSKVMAWPITPIITGVAFLASIYTLLIRSSSAFLYFQF